MPVTLGNYDVRGGGNKGIVVRCPNVVADRLVYFDYNPGRIAWVIRDFITGQRLDNNDSPLAVAAIEADADYDEFPPWHNAEKNISDWNTYLTLRTTAIFKLRGMAVSIATPNPASGTWRAL